MATSKKAAGNRKKVTSQVHQFQGALEAAKKRHAEAMTERAAAASSIALLDIEIPNLEQTIRALTAQLSGQSNPIPVQPRISVTQAAGVPFVVQQRATGTNGGPVKLPEIDNSMGSIPATADASEFEEANPEVDLDALDQFGGEFQ